MLPRAYGSLQWVLSESGKSQIAIPYYAVQMQKTLSMTGKPVKASPQE